jgi:hypothetical protein
VTAIAALLIYNPPKKLQRMTNKVGLTFNVDDMIWSFAISIELIRNGDTKYHIQCSGLLNMEVLYYQSHLYL